MPEKKMKKKQENAAPHVLPAVKDVILWTLHHAGIVTGSFALGIAYTLTVSCISQPPSWLVLGPVEEMTTEADEGQAGGLVTALWIVCAVSQAAAGALALRRPRHRLLLAYAALVATAAGHSMWARLHRRLVAADPEGRLAFWNSFTTAAIFMSGVGDLICFLGLVFRGGKE